MWRRGLLWEENGFVDKEADEVAQEVWIVLDMGDDVNLVEEDTGVDDIERRVVNGSCEDNVFQKLESVGVVNLALYADVTDRDRLVEMGLFVQELAIVCFVVGEVGVI